MTKLKTERNMRSRQDIEELEFQNLAPYAMKSRESSGRQFTESQHPFRTCYQRDRDRVVHSEAFRKLEYKTQVFVVFEGDYYRTRLTHTLEVAQIGRTIGRALRLNEDLIEAIALAHDLGHPPFGHAGEEALDERMRRVEQGRFNHNMRSFEIVTRLERRYPDFDGLNLTKEVLIGILKHQTKYDVVGEAGKYFNEGPTIEAQVVDFADSLAYLNHDIDDGLQSGCITIKDLVESHLWQRACADVHGKVGDDLEMLRYQVVKQLIDMQIQDLLETTDQRLQDAHFSSSEDVKKSRATVVGFGERMAQEREALQELLNKKLYHHYRVVRMTSKAQRILHDLFDVYLKGPQQLPYSVYERNRKYSEKEIYQLICNHIASMTDRFALEEHKKLFNPYTKV
ncbi:MAG: deoxyguanosinetriphosphate triphosphohydrolase [Candidatus Omnitrophica bacterium]|nr:deoxyguanosinetriphosphate triphosphohydrolase [Candidatus Omnitrophota bacterium]